MYSPPKRVRLSLKKMRPEGEDATPAPYFVFSQEEAYRFPVAKMPIIFTVHLYWVYSTTELQAHLRNFLVRAKHKLGIDQSVGNFL